MEQTLPSSIELKLSRNGYYSWNIYIPFTGTEQAISELKDIDSKLRDSFPKNTAQTLSSSFKKFISED